MGGADSTAQGSIMGNCFRSTDHDIPPETVIIYRRRRSALEAWDLNPPLLGSLNKYSSFDSRLFSASTESNQPPLKQWISSTPYSSASFTVTKSASTIEWKGYGLRIHILDNSIPQYLTTARMDVSIHSINSKNPDSLPLSADDWPSDNDRADPVSALYSIKVGSGKLCKPVTIEIQHCSQSECTPHLKILHAASEGEYFKPIKGAIFDQRTNYGRVIVPKLIADDPQEYDNFSWFIIVLRRVFSPNTIHYKAQVYISRTTLKMHFVVMMAVDLCTTVCIHIYNA